MGLEIKTNKVPGSVIRSTDPQRPALMGLAILLLTAIELTLMVLIFIALANGANHPTDHDPAIDGAPLGTVISNEQSIIALWLAGVFFCLGTITLLYQRYFMDHVTVAKRRFRKWEDEGVQLHD